MSIKIDDPYRWAREANPTAHLIVNDYAALGKALHITEFTPASNGEPVVGSAIGGVWDEARQAEHAENFYRVCFGHPAMRGITWWDLRDSGSWRKGGGLLRQDLSPKPAYEALRKLIHEEWTTRVEGVTDRSGVFAFRGYYGDYRVTVKRGAESRIDAFSLARGKDNAWVTEPGAPAK